jgi:hypothetical protein
MEMKRTKKTSTVQEWTKAVLDSVFWRGHICRPTPPEGLKGKKKENILIKEPMKQYLN